MGKISEIRFVGIDFESAGAAKGRTDVPVQVGMAEWTVEGGLGDPFVSYLATDEPITWGARKVHGISDEDLVGAPAMMELWPEFKERLGGENTVVVAHGYGTEKRFLRAFAGHGFGPWADTLLLSRAVWPGLKKHGLGAICEEFGLDRFKEMVPDRKWHDALFDTLASLELLAFIVKELDLAESEVDVLLNPDVSEWKKLRR